MKSGIIQFISESLTWLEQQVLLQSPRNRSQYMDSYSNMSGNDCCCLDHYKLFMVSYGKSYVLLQEKIILSCQMQECMTSKHCVSKASLVLELDSCLLFRADLLEKSSLLPVCVDQSFVLVRWKETHDATMNDIRRVINDTTKFVHLWQCINNMQSVTNNVLYILMLLPKS